MAKQWEAETLVRFDDLLLPESVDAELMRDFCDPAEQETLLLYGPPGTGKSVLCAAIAAERCGAQSLQEMKDWVYQYDFKNRRQRQSVNGERLFAQTSYASFNDCGAIFIFDEIDELTEIQQKELTEFINAANKSVGVTILATTNVDLRQRAEATKLSPALVSRFSYKQLVEQQSATEYLRVVQQKFVEAGLSRSDADVLALLESNFGDETVSFRDVRPFINTMIRRLSRKQAPPVERLVS